MENEEGFRDPVKSLLVKALEDANSGESPIIIVSDKVNSFGDGSKEVIGTYEYKGSRVRDVVAHYDKEEEFETSPLKICTFYVRNYVPSAVIVGSKIFLGPGMKIK
jgi:hypothetical protein